MPGRIEPVLRNAGVTARQDSQRVVLATGGEAAIGMLPQLRLRLKNLQVAPIFAEHRLDEDDEAGILGGADPPIAGMIGGFEQVTQLIRPRLAFPPILSGSLDKFE